MNLLFLLRCISMLFENCLFLITYDDSHYAPPPSLSLTSYFLLSFSVLLLSHCQILYEVMSCAWSAGTVGKLMNNIRWLSLETPPTPHSSQSHILLLYFCNILIVSPHILPPYI